MDSVEVAVRFTEAIMYRAKADKAADLPEQYVELFAEMLKRLNVVMPSQPTEPPPPRPPLATSEIFPLTHDR